MFHIASEEWTTMITGYRGRLREVKIIRDLSPQHAKFILSQLDDLYSEVRLTYGDVRKQYDETESLIERIRRKAESIGTNTEMRKANGVKSVENVELGDTRTINLYTIRTTLGHQKEDLDGILAVIEKKQSVVITMSGLLKIESTISGH